MARLVYVCSNEAVTAKAVMKRLEAIAEKEDDFTLSVIPLQVGDYVTGKHYIERKRIGDFLSSIQDNRVWRQAEDLVKASEEFKMNPVILIEGSPTFVLKSPHHRGFNPASFIGVWDALQKEYKIQVVHSPNAFFTVLWILRFAREETNKEAIRAVRRASKGTWPMDIKARYVLEGVRGIGGVTSTRMLEHYESLENIFLAALTNPLKDKRLKEVKRMLKHRYGSEEET